MKAFVFPGFDSLEVKSERENSLQLPEVQKMIAQVQEILQKNHLNETDLVQFILSDDKNFNSQLGLKVATSVAVQVGVFNQWKLAGESVDFIMGCSLGDLARSVCAGIVELEAIVCGGYKFGESLMSRPRGEIYKCSTATSISLKELEQSLPVNTHVAVFQTPKHFLIAGEGEAFHKWITERISKGFRIYKMADVPLHSPLMQDVSETMKDIIDSASVKSPQMRIFSSVWCREISTRSEFAQEISDNITHKVNWVSSLRQIIENLGVNEIISMGPASTLLKFSERIPVGRKYQSIDAFKILIERHGVFA